MIIMIAMISIETGRALKGATKNNTSIGIFETSLLKFFRSNVFKK